MITRSLVLPLVATLALTAGCAKTIPGAATQAMRAAQAMAAADLADEPCDEAVVKRIAAFKNHVVGKVVPAMKVAGAVDKPEVIEMPSPNRHDRANGLADIDTIVLHHTASAAPAKNIGGFFSQPSAKVSAHYTVDKTGYIVASVPDVAASWHAGKSAFNGKGDVNGFSIGIEICNTGLANDPYPSEQYASLGRLMAHLMTKYDIKWNRVTRHRDVALPAGRKNDTSDGFDVKLLQKATADAGGPAAALNGLALSSFLNLN